MFADLDFNVWGAALIGLGVGYLSGMFGVGGGFIASPLLNCVLDIPMRIVSGSSLAQISGASLAGLLRHRRHGQFDARIAVIVMGGMFAGEEAGIALLERLKSGGTVLLAGGEFELADLVLRGVLLAMLAVIGTAVYLEARAAARNGDGSQHTRPRAIFARIRFGPGVAPAGAEPVPVVLVAFAGLPIGMAQGLLGIGGGVLMLPTLIYCIGVGTHAAVGTDLMVIFAGSVWGTLRHAMHGNVSLALTCALMITATFGSQLGAVTTTKLAGHRLRRYFSLVVAAAALVLAWKLAGMFGFLS